MRSGLFTLVLLAGCPAPVAELDSGLEPDGGVISNSDAGDLTCAPCVVSSDCGSTGACVQLGGSDSCAVRCETTSCAPGSTCQPATTEDGTSVAVCIPSSGCGTASCPPSCPAGTACNQVTAQCEPAVTPVDAGSDGGTLCGTLRAPATNSTCRSCTGDAGACQPNGCFGGWWCDETTSRCVRPPSSCAGSDAGVRDAGPPPLDDAGVSATIGPNGGTASRLYFAVVGDTRPPFIDDTPNYPSAVISGIYAAIEAMSPRPQFVITTGDYMFARTTGTQGVTQMGKYKTARAGYSGLVFPAFGNHECTGATAGNCAGAANVTSNLVAFRDALLQPLGKTELYYAFDVNEPGGRWTAKFIVAACNAWDTTQEAWLSQQLARSTTFTFVVRHEALGVAAPCTTAMDAQLRARPPTMMLVGHTHTFSHSGTQLVEGVGGAPISGNAVYGYATIEQLTSGFRVVQFDSAARAVVSTFTVP